MQHLPISQSINQSTKVSEINNFFHMTWRVYSQSINQSTKVSERNNFFSQDLEGLKKPLIPALKGREQILTRKNTLSTAAAIKTECRQVLEI